MSFLSGNILWNLLWIIPLILALAITGGVRRNKLLRKMFGTDERIARFSDVLAFAVPDEPGALARILEAVDATGANVEYMYAFAVARGASARFIFRFDDTEKAVAALSAAGISLLDDATIFA